MISRATVKKNPITDEKVEEGHSTSPIRRGKTLEGKDSRHPARTTESQLQSYMPALPPECVQLGYDRRLLWENGLSFKAEDNSQLRKSRVLEDNLYVQLLLPKILQETPRIEDVEPNSISPPLSASQQPIEVVLTPSEANLYMSQVGLTDKIDNSATKFQEEQPVVASKDTYHH